MAVCDYRVAETPPDVRKDIVGWHCALFLEGAGLSVEVLASYPVASVHLGGPCHCLRRDKYNYVFVLSPWPMANPVNISKFEETVVH